MAEVGSLNNASKETDADVKLMLSEHVHHVRMDDQVIVADMRTGHYLGLDGVGARVWDLIGEHLGRDAIVERLYAEYDVSMEVLKRDVGELLRDLLQRRLVEREPNSTSSATSQT